MEVITSSQRQQASAIWTDFRANVNKQTAHLNSPSPTTAFIALGLLNLPAPAAYHLLKARATRQAIASWPETWNARWIAHYFPEKEASLLADHISSQVRNALHPLTTNLVLSPLTTSRNRYWTLLTANLTHLKPTHLLSNMLALNAIAPACVEVPGMTALHVVGITVTTSLATSAHALYRLSDAWGWTMCGFSAVLCAFTSVAALGAPVAERDDDGRYPLKARSVWTVAAMQIGSDVIAMLRARNGSAGSSGSGSVDYVGHLVGYACGAAYYAYFLWWRRFDDDSADGGSYPECQKEIVESSEVQKEEEQPSEATIAEILQQHADEARSAWAPTKESEDWEEVASKLGYNPEEDSET